MTIEDIYKTFKNFKEITKEQYFSKVMGMIGDTERITDFAMTFDLQGEGAELPGVLGYYTDFLNKYEPTNIGSDGDLYRKWGKELFSLYCSTFFESVDGDLIQLGTLEYQEPSFNRIYLELLYGLEELMTSNVSGLRASLLENYRYFETPDGFPAAVPEEVYKDPSEVKADTRAAYT